MWKSEDRKGVSATVCVCLKDKVTSFGGMTTGVQSQRDELLLIVIHFRVGGVWSRI